MLQLIAVIAVQVFLIVFFIHYVVHNDQGQKEPNSGIVSAIIFGIIAILLTMLLTGFIKLLPGFSEVTNISLDSISTSSTTTAYLFLATLLIAIIEEGTKALPFALFIYKKPYFNELTDGVFYFGITGVTFGVIESIIYTLLSGAQIGLLRIIIAPFLHAGFSIWFGYALARYKLRIGGLTPVLLAFIGSILLHTLYNFGLLTNSSWLLIGSFILALFLNASAFILYKHARKLDLKLIASGREASPTQPPPQ